ncbi:MAG: group III truncated hemoglobin [Saprospiraceae bacterium]|nr:group III truncated hemoglobin [Saprospiraceae bacterium]
MKDIQTRADLEKLLASFYQKLLADASISYLFTEVAQIDLEEHLPVLVNFWEGNLLGGHNYKGNPMGPHFTLHQKSPLGTNHFKTWLHHWTETIDELFEGPMADEAKSRARSIALLMQHKIEQAFGPLNEAN